MERKKGGRKERREKERDRETERGGREISTQAGMRWFWVRDERGLEGVRNQLSFAVVVLKEGTQT